MFSKDFNDNEICPPPYEKKKIPTKKEIFDLIYLNFEKEALKTLNSIEKKVKKNPKKNRFYINFNNTSDLLLDRLNAKFKSKHNVDFNMSVEPFVFCISIYYKSYFKI